MAKLPYKTALMVGVGPGISISLARRLSVLGVTVGLSQPRSAWSFDVDLRPWTEPF